MVILLILTILIKILTEFWLSIKPLAKIWIKISKPKKTRPRLIILPLRVLEIYGIIQVQGHNR